MAGKKINNPHDKFFRATMAHHRVAVDFFNHHLPKNILQALNVDSLKLTQQSYIDNSLQDSISDLVFSCELADKPAYLTLLVEHQSSPDKMLAFRVHHYLFGMLYNHRKQYPGCLLPAVYTLVFYHGEDTPYPYSLNLLDCFDDPLKLMQDVLYQPVPLIDVNQLSDEELKQQQWVGPMALALKHIREAGMTPYAMDILNALPWSMSDLEAVELLQLLLSYLLKVGKIEDINTFVEVGSEQLPKPVRSEMMTAAEALEERGIQKGKLEGKLEGIQEGIQEGVEKVVLAMLEVGTELAFIAKMTGLPEVDIERLRISLDNTA